MPKYNESMQGFANTIHKLLRSDRDVNIGVGGFTGEGKSTFSTKLLKEYAKISGTYWGFDRMTWSRKEMLKWIDGEGNEKAGQIPEYSSILPDELFAMFYSRNWYEDDQKDAISTFNTCRDRHLLVCGNVPNFWELDKGFTNRIRFYVYIPFRGIAWVFEQENNPFSTDPWNKTKNQKLFRESHQQPYKLPNFLFEIKFDDWDEYEREKYYAIRNEKRKHMGEDVRSSRGEKYSTIKRQRDALIIYAFDTIPKVTKSKIASVMGLDKSTVSKIIEGYD